MEVWEFSSSDGTRTLYEEARAVISEENKTYWNIWISMPSYHCLPVQKSMKNPQSYNFKNYVLA